MTTPILMYRSIDETVPRGFRRRVVRPARLPAQARGLAEAGHAATVEFARQWAIAKAMRRVRMTE
jgi:hypothetical protein